MEEDEINVEVEDDSVGDYIEVMQEAKAIKDTLKLESIDTALLIMIYQSLDTIRFHNSD